MIDPEDGHEPKHMKEKDPEEIFQEQYAGLSAADKKALTECSKHHFMLIQFKYARFILKFEEGLKVIAALRNAEYIDRFSEYDETKNRIHPLELEDIQFRPITEEKYLLWKARSLLCPKARA